jgi:hypothetical protein
LKEPGIDDERLGALLEGRVSEPARGELLARLSASDDDFGVFAETAAVLRELEGAASDADPDGPETGAGPDEPGGAGAPPPEAERALRVSGPAPPSVRRPGGWRRPSARWLALAAVLALAVLVPVLRPWGGGGRLTPERAAGLLAGRGGGLPGGWTEQRRPWDATLGPGDPALLISMRLRMEGFVVHACKRCGRTAGLRANRTPCAPT